MDSDGVKYCVSRNYALVNAELGKSWYEYKDFKPKWNQPDDYYLLEKVGRGKYSTVFKGLINKKEEVAIKILVPLDPKRYLKEIKILINMRGGPNIVNLVDLVYDRITNIYSFVFEWVEFHDWRSLYRTFDIHDVRLYCYQLLEALDYCHSKGIMHRDIKPANVAIDKEKKKLRLLDWGLADFYFPKLAYSARVGTRIFKPPELLINYPYYDYSLDIWATGLTFASMMFGTYIFNHGANDVEQLYKVAEVIGGKEIIEYAKSLNVELDDRMIKELKKTPYGTGIGHFVKKAGSRAPPEALDLLYKMLVVDHRNRISAKEAMKHPFFKPLKQNQY
ncbi:CMGC family protein kinase [Tritrichomonas foetus]|uniref:non-specific serine/threonine protein kinase n=1 Tax=Tritrichomonas foetus TaxID=1144522 RepID=A0A1J4JDS2_9EUKA|nr:CMGC family protein kinase [Tritrichomonas foetus]|eukprot:OHS95404.1 CMGC family protein kinase [Tritrichomonas foetus]